MTEKILYTGYLYFKGDEFTFVYQDSVLALIPSKEKCEAILNKYRHMPIISGVYTQADPVEVDEPCIICECNETNSEICFILKNGSFIKYNHNNLYLDISAVFLFKGNRKKISRMIIKGKEIDSIFPANQVYECSFPDEKSNGKNYGVSLTNDGFIKKEIGSFDIEENSVSFSFCNYIKLSEKEINTPFQSYSGLIIDYDETDNYLFVYDVYRVALRFINYLCYKKNTRFDSIILYKKSGEYLEEYAKLIVVDYRYEKESISDRSLAKCIKYNQIEEYITLVSDLANNKIFTEHHPISADGRRNYDPARFILTTSAFEWEFRKLFPNGMEKSELRQSLEKEIKTDIDKLRKVATGEKADILNSLKGIVGNHTMKEKITYTLNSLNSIIKPFADNLYQKHKEEYDYEKIAGRLTKQRNNFAHGNIDKKFIELSLLDLFLLERLVYVMQLKYYDMDDKKIQRAIADVFMQHVV